MEKLEKYIKPMLATLVEKPFDDPDWIFEIKFDGYRAIANIGKEVQLVSRNGLVLNEDFPDVVEELKNLKEHMILDGEVTVVDENGRTDFQLLQNYIKTREGNLVYYVFDILEYGKENLRGLSLTKRKEMLKKVLPNLNHVRYSAHIEAKGIEFYKLAKQKNLEGIMAKKKESIYEDGVRGMNWQKIKIHLQQEVVIGGYTFPDGMRSGFGSILVGVYDHGQFVYVGNVGTGFDESDLSKIKTALDKYKVDHSPFSNLIEMNNVAAWVKPVVVAEVKFQEWTDSGSMRQAVFLGLRDDVKPENVRRENPKN